MPTTSSSAKSLSAPRSAPFAALGTALQKRGRFLIISNSSLGIFLLASTGFNIVRTLPMLKHLGEGASATSTVHLELSPVLLLLASFFYIALIFAFLWPIINNLSLGVALVLQGRNFQKFPDWGALTRVYPKASIACL